MRVVSSSAELGLGRPNEKTQLCGHSLDGTRCREPFASLPRPAEPLSGTRCLSKQELSGTAWQQLDQGERGREGMGGSCSQAARMGPG